MRAIQHGEMRTSLSTFSVENTSTTYSLCFFKLEGGNFGILHAVCIYQLATQ